MPDKKATNENCGSVTSHDDLPTTQCIENKIVEIRGQQVMLDRDLAMLYGVETKRLNEQVKRNKERFPEDFMFQLTDEDCSRSQIATLNTDRGKNIKYLPYAFTENGIAMLSGVLRSQTAIEANIRIMRAFSAMRKFLINNAQIFQRLDKIENKQIETNHNIDIIFNRLGQTSKPQQWIFYNGQVFDSYVFVSDLIKQANSSITLIDNYVDESVLILLDKRAKGVDATVYTMQISRRLQLDVNKHNAQYQPIDIRICYKNHDRFLCIDEDVYHIGASIKDLGNKLFAFARLNDIKTNELLNKMLSDSTAEAGSDA